MPRATALVLAAALAATPATADFRDSALPDAAPVADPPLTLLLGDQYRWPHLVLPLRFAADVIAIPASVARWDQRDFGLFLAYAAAVGALMTPTSNGVSADAQFQRWARSGQTPGHYLVWTRLGDALVWGGIWTVPAAALAYGWLTDDAALLESVSLMLEAFSMAQVWQVGIKLALGREGPRDGEGLGEFHGPPGFFRLFPAGTPSGHSAALYAMIGAASAYWDQPMLDVAMHLFGLAFCVTLVTDDYHFVSDVLWGAAMGYYTGRWVVRNRSTHYRFDAGALVPATVVPVVAPNSGSYGLALGWAF